MTDKSTVQVYHGEFDKTVCKDRWRKVGLGFVTVTEQGKGLALHIERDVCLKAGAMLVIRRLVTR